MLLNTADTFLIKKQGVFYNYDKSDFICNTQLCDLQHATSFENDIPF